MKRSHNAADADDDPDMDGMTSLQEFTAGTNPTNKSSNLRILSITTPASNQTALTWTSVSQRRDGIDRSTNLLTDLSPVESNLAATPPSNTFTGSVATPAAMFYRVNVRK